MLYIRRYLGQITHSFISMPREKPRKSAENKQNGNHNRHSQPVSYQSTPLFVSPLCLLPFECIVHWTAHYTYVDAIGIIHCVMRCVRVRRTQQCRFHDYTSIVFPSFQFHRCVFRSCTSSIESKHEWPEPEYRERLKKNDFRSNKTHKRNSTILIFSNRTKKKFCDGHEKLIAKGNGERWEKKEVFNKVIK